MKNSCNKQRLFEIMGKVDKTFKSKLNEESYSDYLDTNYDADGLDDKLANQNTAEETYKLYDAGFELFKRGDVNGAENLRQKAIKTGSWFGWGDSELPPYKLEENSSRDKNFKFHEGDNVTFIDKDNNQYNGIISNYDYHLMTWKPAYDIEYIKNGKTWTAIGIPEDRITLKQEASNDEYQKRYNQNKMMRQIDNLGENEK